MSTLEHAVFTRVLPRTASRWQVGIPGTDGWDLWQQVSAHRFPEHQRTPVNSTQQIHHQTMDLALQGLTEVQGPCLCQKHRVPLHQHEVNIRIFIDHTECTRQLGPDRKAEGSNRSLVLTALPRGLPQGSEGHWTVGRRKELCLFFHLW